MGGKDGAVDTRHADILRGDMTASEAAELFQSHRDELGFVNRAQCREKDLVTIRRGGDVVGAALGNHCIRKPQTTLYELAVDSEYRRNGIASLLVDKLASDSPHSKLIAKCPADLEANAFYEATGWDRIDVDPGKSRELNVYEYSIPKTRIATTGRPDLTTYARRHDWIIGTRLDSLPAYEAAGISPDFIDVHWEDPDREGLLEACQKHTPSLVVAGDYDGQNYETINAFADKLRQYATDVIIVPHEPGEVDRVPEWAVVGYSTPTSYAGTDAPIWEYYGRDVHVLGGTMAQIKMVVNHLGDNIVSLDTNTHHRDATQFGEYFTPSKPTRKRIIRQGTNIREAYENSVVNMTYTFETWGLIEPRRRRC